MTSTESYVTDDTSHINTVNDATDDAIYDAISAVTPDWFSTIKQSAYPLYIKESDIELVFQEHKSQETYVLTHDDFWRVRKSDYSLEFGGKIYENWPFLCTFWWYKVLSIYLAKQLSLFTFSLGWTNNDCLDK